MVTFLTVKLNHTINYKLDFFKDLATLNPNQLVDKVKDLFEYAYQLGLEECNLCFFVNNKILHIN